MSIPIEVSDSRPARGAHRVPTSTRADYRKALDRGSLQVSDLSITGAKITTLNPLSAGTRIWIKLPTLEAKEAEVVWVDNFDAGCRFIEPLHPAVFDRLLQALSTK